MKIAHWTLLACCSLQAAAAVAEDYDPLVVQNAAATQKIDLEVRDGTRDREIPLRIYLPQVTAPAPVVLFSHGLGGSRSGSAYLGKHWSARGYVAVFLQHLGSDDSVWRDQPLGKRMAAMREAASGKNFLLRAQDVPAVLDQLQSWNETRDHRLSRRLDLNRVGMSGHSFGAVTTQAVSGQAFGLLGQRFTDKRIKAAVIFSPSTPRRGDADKAFQSVEIPWLLMTGTKDLSPIGGANMASRLGVYPRLPETIDRYELVLHNAEHSAFTDRALPGDLEPRNPNHHRAILALSTAFWDAHLRGDAAARAWLNGDRATAVLEGEDRWQFEATGTK